MGQPDSHSDDLPDPPAFSEDWINDAAVKEEPGDVRAERYRRIAAGHQRVQREREQDRTLAAKSYAKQRARPWLIAGSVLGAVLLIMVLL